MATPNQPKPLLTEEQAAAKAADEFGGIHGRLALAEANESERIDKVVKSLQRQYPELSDENAQMWAEVRSEHAHATLQEAKDLTEGRRTSKRLEMTPEFEEHVKAAREKVKATLKQANVNMIRRGLEESLKGDDYFEVYAFIDDAKKMGISSADINNIVDTAPTNLDREAIKKGELPLSAIA